MKSTAKGVPINGDVRSAFQRSRTRQAFIFLLLIAAIVVGAFGFGLTKKKALTKTYTHYSAAGVPAAGMVAKVLVAKGQWVRKGELLAVLDYSRLEAGVETAEMEYQAALARTRTSPQATALPAPPGLAGGFEKRAVAVPMPPMPHLPTPATVSPSKPNPKSTLKTGPSIQMPGTTAKPSGSPPKLKALQDQIKTLQASLPSLEKKITDDKTAADAAEALVAAAQSVADRSLTQKNKSASLLAQGVISAKDAAQAESNYSQSQGQVQSARLKAAEAEAALGDDQQELDKSNADLQKAQNELLKVQVVATAPPNPTPIAHPPVKSLVSPAVTPPPVQTYKLVKLKGPVPGTPPPMPLQVDFTSPAEAAAKLKKAETDLAVAQQKLAEACIYAPVNGQISQINLRAGQMVQPGLSAFTILVR